MLDHGAVMDWLREAINDNRTKQASSKRVVMLLAGAAMSLAVVILAAAALLGHEVALALGAVCVPLAGMSGYGYVKGKAVEKDTP